MQMAMTGKIGWGGVGGGIRRGGGREEARRQTDTIERKYVKKEGMG